MARPMPPMAMITIGRDEVSSLASSSGARD
jgi:hypothetical protein